MKRRDRKKIRYREQLAGLEPDVLAVVSIAKGIKHKEHR